MQNGLVRIHYFGGQQVADVYPDIAAQLIASNLAEAVIEGAESATPILAQPETAAIVPHKETAVAKPAFIRNPTTMRRLHAAH